MFRYMKVALAPGVAACLGACLGGSNPGCMFRCMKVASTPSVEIAIMLAK